jgi:hypothetical protein
LSKFKSKERASMLKVTIIGVDLAKNVSNCTGRLRTERSCSGRSSPDRFSSGSWRGIIADMWQRDDYGRPDGGYLESLDVFQSVNDPSAYLQIDGPRLGLSPSFKSTGRDPPAEREFCLVEMRNAHVVFPLWLGTAMPTSEIRGRAGNAIPERFCHDFTLLVGQL